MVCSAGKVKMHRYLLGLLLCLEGAALSGVASSPSVPQTAQSGVQPAIRAANALVGDGSLLTNLNEVRAEHVTVLELPTMDGTNSVTHPNLLLSERLVGGYRYWLTYTPFPLANREWVSIAASHD